MIHLNSNPIRNLGKWEGFHKTYLVYDPQLAAFKLKKYSALSVVARKIFGCFKNSHLDFVHARLPHTLDQTLSATDEEALNKIEKAWRKKHPSALIQEEAPSKNGWFLKVSNHFKASTLSRRQSTHVPADKNAKHQEFPILTQAHQLETFYSRYLSPMINQSYESLLFVHYMDVAHHLDLTDLQLQKKLAAFLSNEVREALADQYDVIRERSPEKLNQLDEFFAEVYELFQAFQEKDPFSTGCLAIIFMQNGHEKVITIPCNLAEDTPINLISTTFVKTGHLLGRLCYQGESIIDIETPRVDQPLIDFHIKQGSTLKESWKLGEEGPRKWAYLKAKE